MARSESEILPRLQAWYVSNVDGDWEHSSGVDLGTLDNPGWHFEISLTDTSLQSEPFEEMNLDRTDHDWIRCWVSEESFHARCGPQNLAEALSTFLDWAAAHPPDKPEQLFNNGDAVVVQGPRTWERAGEPATISGFRRVETIDESVRFRCRLGTVVYLIALSDGSAREVLGDALEASPTT